MHKPNSSEMFEGSPPRGQQGAYSLDEDCQRRLVEIERRREDFDRQAERERQRYNELYGDANELG